MSKRSFAQMSKHLQQAQHALAESRAENEDLKQRMNAAARVKEFLVGRLGETEALVRQAKEEKEQVLAQAASDREVMAFLDERVKELEEEAQKTAEEMRTLKQGSTDAHGQHTSKSKMLEEMVRMAEAQRQEAEDKFKAQKRVLVKEIKSLRSQVALLTDAVKAQRRKAAAGQG